MKPKNIILISLLYLAFSLPLNAQIELKINPLGITLGSPDVSAEFIISDNIGIEPVFILSTGSTEISGLKYFKTGFGGMLATKFYLNPQQGADRFNIGLYGKYQNTDYQLSTFTGGPQTLTNRIAVGILFGSKFVFDNNILIEFGLGFGKTISSTSEGDATFITDLLESLLFKYDANVRLAVGYRFGGGDREGHMSQGRLERLKNKNRKKKKKRRRR